MIKEGIIIGGLVFYTFVITTLIGDIRTKYNTKARKTLPSPSSESSTTTMTEYSRSRK